VRILAPFPQRYLGGLWETCAQCGTSFEGGIPDEHRCTTGEFACICGCGNTGDWCDCDVSAGPCDHQAAMAYR
jgi:hypothetical protein